MDIACPNCAATYRVPEALLAQGKALRCAACGEAWVPLPPPVAESVPEEVRPPEVAAPTETLPAAEPPQPDPFEAAQLQPAQTQLVYSPRLAPPTTPPPLTSRTTLGTRPAMPMPDRPRRSRMLPLAWLASVTLVLLALAGAVIFGDAIAAAWPPFARVTVLIGG